MGGRLGTPYFQDSKTLRFRANQCRTLAETLQDRQSRERMLQIAEDYARLAVQVQAQEQMIRTRIRKPPDTLRPI